MERILIRDLMARTIIGVREHERREMQDVILNIALRVDLSEAMKSDKIHDSLDYSEVKKKILDMVETSSFNLTETLADRIAAICLEFPLVREVEVTVDKPGALRFARSVAVQLTRSRT